MPLASTSAASGGRAATAPAPTHAGDVQSPTNGTNRPRLLNAGALLAFLAYVAITLAFLPGVTTHLATAFPVDLGDPPSQAWILAWNLHALRTDPSQLYHANIFYPFPDVLAYQDTLLGLLPLSAPILLAGGSPVLAYNVLFLLTFVLCAWGAYLLARLLVARTPAAFLAGLVYAFAPYRMVHLSHLNLLSGMWVPFALLCFERARGGRRRYWLGVGLFFVLQALSALYYAAFLAVALTLLLVVHAWRARRDDRTGRPAAVPARVLARDAVLTAFCVGIVLLPFFIPYVRVERALGASRGLGQAIYFAADLRDFLHSVDRSLLYGWSGRALGVLPADAMQYLWPGIVVLCLAAWGLRAARRPLPTAQHAYVLLGLVSAVLCLGPVLKVWGRVTGLPLPYLLLYPLPGFAGLRDPARFGALYTLSLAVLAAYGVAALLRAPWARRRRRGALVTALLCAGVLGEFWIQSPPAIAVPVGTAGASPVPAVYRWLARQPVSQPVLELPIGLQNKIVWAQQAMMMYYSTYHWHPIVNGTGGFAPPGYARDSLLYGSFPSPAALALLRARHVRYVIVHRDWLGASAAEHVRTSAARTRDVRLVARWRDADLYVVR